MVIGCCQQWCPVSLREGGGVTPLVIGKGRWALLDLAQLPTDLLGRVLRKGAKDLKRTRPPIPSIPRQERVVRLGVTGLSRAGKTVFITSLVASLQNHEALVELTAARQGRIKEAKLQPLPESIVPRFPFEDHLRTMISQEDPAWPPGTKSLSKLRLTLRIKRKFPDWLGRLEETIHLDIIDFPGEWLIDLTMMDKSFKDWSCECLEKISFEALDDRQEARAYIKQLKRINTRAPFNEEDTQSLARTFTIYLKALKADGYSSCTPGRFLQPGDLENSAALTFAPLYVRDQTVEQSLYRTFEKRFKDYQEKVIQPFFQQNLSQIDRQVVLVDVMAAIENGPGPFEDQRKAMRDILSVFKPGENSWFTQWFEDRKVEKILFAATKADHLNPSQHEKLSTYPDGVLRESREAADFEGAKTKVMSIAALRVTEEYIYRKDGVDYYGVCGWVLDEYGTRQNWFQYPGELSDIGELLKQAEKGEKQWRAGPISFPKFLPESRNRGQPLPHIRLDKALEFLIGDLLDPSAIF